MNRQLLITFMLLLTTGSIMGQTTIKGVVKDKQGLTIPGANVYVKNTFDGTNSKPDGSFSFNTEETGEQTLVVSFIGYEPFEKAIQLSGETVELVIELSESINKLDGVTITAGAFEASDVKKVTVLKPLDIVTTASAAGDIMGAINTLPGTTTVGESGRVFVRGGEGYETKVFIDGLEVRNAFNSTIPNVPTRGRFSPFLFKGTVFSTGGYSAEFGQALSSVLILNSNDIAKESETQISLMSVGADVSYTQAWENASLSGKIQYTDLRPYQDLVKQDFDWGEGPNGYIGEIVYRQKVRKNGLLKVYANIDNGGFNIRQNNINTGIKDTVDLQNQYKYINVSYADIINKSWSVRGGATYTTNNDEIQFNDFPFADFSQGFHFKLAANWDGHDKLSLNLGTELLSNKFTRKLQSGTDSEYDFSFDDNLLASFAELDYFLSNKFIIRTGLRLEHSELLNKTWLSPRIAASYKTGEKGQFSFAYGNFFQKAQDDYQLVNQALMPERAQHYVLNYQYIHNDRVFRIEAFQKQYDDLVVYQDPNDFNPENYSNAGDGFARGIDIFWRDNKTFKNTDYWVSYSLTDSERLYQDYPEAAMPSFVAKHNFNLVVKHFVPSIRTQFGATITYASPRYFNNPNLEGFQNDQTPYYADLSLNAAFLIKPHIILYASSSNVFGRENIFGYEYTSEPNPEGFYNSQPIGQPAPRFLFLALFITLSKDKTKNQLDNL